MTTGKTRNKRTTRRNARRVAISADRLYRRRVLAGLTQRELAELAGVSTTTVSRLELGGGCSPRLMPVLARALGCEVTDLMKPEAA